MEKKRFQSLQTCAIRAQPDRLYTSTKQPNGTPALAPGDKVVICRLALWTRPFIEGEASIIDAVPGASDLYRVKFKHEPLPVVRLVHAGAWQSHPDRLVADLMAHWRASIAPETFGPSFADISEFGAGMLRRR